MLDVIELLGLKALMAPVSSVAVNVYPCFVSNYYRRCNSVCVCLFVCVCMHVGLAVTLQRWVG